MGSIVFLRPASRNPHPGWELAASDVCRRAGGRATGPQERGQVSFEFVGDCFGYSLPLLVHTARVDLWMLLTMLGEAVRLRHSTLRKTRLAAAGRGCVG